jgi:diguanylate cyclase (GGDEF)-like protein
MSALRPWGTIIGLLFEDGSSDYVLNILSRSGIPTEEFRLTQEEGHRHTTRKRAYRKRLDHVYAGFDEATRLRVAENIAKELARGDHGERLNKALLAVGWAFQNDSLVPLNGPGEGQLDDRLPLFRRRVFDRDLETFVRLAKEKRRPLSLLMLDLDKFKAVNDQHGHPIGDEGLQDFAEIVSTHMEGKGQAYRYGGDEVAALLPNFSIMEALAIGEELRRLVESSRLSTKAHKMTLSVGVACFPDHAGDGQSLLQQADEALYQAKELGRNLVRMSGDTKEIVQPVRKVDRRQPTPGTLRDQEQEAIRLAYFRDGRAECPRDGATLNVITLEDMQSRTPDLLVRCPVCGLEVMLPGLRR